MCHQEHRLITALILASAGAEVVVPVRDWSKAKTALEPYPELQLESLDLIQPASVQDFADTFIASELPLHILVNNAVIASYDCNKAFSVTDLTDDLKKVEVPTLILHRDADQIAPVENSAYLSVKIVKGAKFRVIPGAPHGMCTTHAGEINSALLDVLRA